MELARKQILPADARDKFPSIIRSGCHNLLIFRNGVVRMDEVKMCAILDAFQCGGPLPDVYGIPAHMGNLEGIFGWR
jgi:hypothetical protein